MPWIHDGNTTPALGPLYLYSVLKSEGFGVRLFDARIDPLAVDRLIAFSSDIVGISTV